MPHRSILAGRPHPEVVVFLVAVVVVAALAVPLAGGRLGALVEVRLRHVWAIFAALGLEVAAIELPGLPEGLRAALMVAAYPVGAVFLAANWRVPGMPLVALGGALNLLAISVNGGVMPASPSAMAGAGLNLEPGFQNSTALAEPRLAFLGDVFYLPASWPLSNVFSVGDVLIALGGRLGAAPHLPVTPGPTLDPPTLVDQRSPRPRIDASRMAQLEEVPERGA